jgi:phage-related protein
MSHPILYDKHATQFFNLGLGVLKDAVRCMVTEERNGVFELEMTYPNEGALADLLEVDYLIKADAGHAGF